MPTDFALLFFLRMETQIWEKLAALYLIDVASMFSLIIQSRSYITPSRKSDQDKR